MTTILFYIIGWFVVGLISGLGLVIFENWLNNEIWDKFDRDRILLTALFCLIGPMALFALVLRVGMEFFVAFCGIILETFDGKTFYLTGKRGRDDSNKY